MGRGLFDGVDVMGEKKLPMYLSMKELQENIVTWNRDTIKKRVAEDGFPMVRDEKGQLLFPREKVLEWFKRREVQS